jgi:hypothetical protein
MAEAGVDGFVAAVNASRRVPLPCGSVPELCRGSAAADGGYCDWHIASGVAGPWLGELAAQLPNPWPMSFHALVSRYQFPSFICDPLEFYSVGLTDASDDSDELRIAVLRDRHMVSVLWGQGYLPFARPEDSSYDPVCFDYRNLSQTGEPAVVRIDHEEVLCRSRIRIRQVLSPAVDLLLENMTARLLTGISRGT